MPVISPGCRMTPSRLLVGPKRWAAKITSAVQMQKGTPRKKFGFRHRRGTGRMPMRRAERQGHGRRAPLRPQFTTDPPPGSCPTVFVYLKHSRIQIKLFSMACKVETGFQHAFYKLSRPCLTVDVRSPAQLDLTREFGSARSLLAPSAGVWVHENAQVKCLLQPKPGPNFSLIHPQAP